MGEKRFDARQFCFSNHLDGSFAKKDDFFSLFSGRPRSRRKKLVCASQLRLVGSLLDSLKNILTGPELPISFWREQYLCSILPHSHPLCIRFPGYFDSKDVRVRTYVRIYRSSTLYYAFLCQFSAIECHYFRRKFLEIRPVKQLNNSLSLSLLLSCSVFIFCVGGYLWGEMSSAS